MLKQERAVLFKTRSTEIYKTYVSSFGRGQEHNGESFCLFCDDVQKAEYCSRANNGDKRSTRT